MWAPLLILLRPTDPKPNPIALVVVCHRATDYPAAAASAAAMASSLSRALLRRVAELARGRLRANHRMLSSASSTAAIERALQLPAEAQAVRMTEGCVRVRTSLLLTTSRSFRCIFPNPYAILVCFLFSLGLILCYQSAILERVSSS
jgi:hypothetical protein